MIFVLLYLINESIGLKSSFLSSAAIWHPDKKKLRLPKINNDWHWHSGKKDYLSYNTKLKAAGEAI